MGRSKVETQTPAATAVPEGRAMRQASHSCEGGASILSAIAAYLGLKRRKPRTILYVPTLSLERTGPPGLLLVPVAGAGRAWPLK